jgi:hypothetical protein
VFGDGFEQATILRMDGLVEVERLRREKERPDVSGRSAAGNWD